LECHVLEGKGRSVEEFLKIITDMGPSDIYMSGEGEDDFP